MQEQLDIQAWERELNHAAKMQAQREGWDGKKVGTIGANDSRKSPAIYCSVVPLLWHKTGTEYEK